MMTALKLFGKLICFQSKYPRDSTNFVFSLCYWLDYWSLLQKPEAKKKLMAGSLMLRSMIRGILNKGHGWSLSKRL